MQVRIGGRSPSICELFVFRKLLEIANSKFLTSMIPEGIHILTESDIISFWSAANHVLANAAVTYFAVRQKMICLENLGKY